MVSYENLWAAIDAAAEGKRDRADVAKVLENRDKYIKRLQNLLITKTYTIPRHKPVHILDNSSRKERTIIKPYYCYEQILHHATVRVLKPMFMHGMYEYVCGSVPERGGTYGKRYIEQYIRKNPAEIKYCVKLDIRHFFQSIPHDKLKAMLHKKIHDDDMLWLLDYLIDSYEDSPGRGIPLGYYTSQWLANFYLQGLDHYIKELGTKCYVRYMDDMVFFGKSKKKLHELRRLIGEYLQRELGLELKDNWQVFRFDYTYKGKRYGRPLDYMGYIFYRDKTLIRKSIMINAGRKARAIAKKKRKGEKVTWYDASQMLARLAWYKDTDCYGSYLTYIKPYINVRTLKRKVSAHDKRRNQYVCSMERCTINRGA